MNTNIEFNTWYEKWIFENNFMDYYLTSEQKEILYKSNIWKSDYDHINNYDHNIEEMINNIHLLDYEINEEYPRWVKEWQKKNNFSDNLICDSTHDMLFKAKFLNDEEEIEKIRINLQKSKDEYNNDYKSDNESDNEEIVVEKDFIREWFNQHKFNKKQLLQILSITNEKYRELI